MIEDQTQSSEPTVAVIQIGDSNISSVLSDFKGAQSIREEAILSFWDTNEIFKKTLAKKSPKGEFVFFDGPPYATGSPHFGHLLPSTIKDAIPRYKTMQGYHVNRKWGWDCHGLPIENLIEKKLGLQDKKAIIDFGIDKFNKAARESVFQYDAEWKSVVHRMGRFVDMNNAYHTMDSSYTESVWWSFSELHKKGLVYEGYRVMQICPRCETTLSNFEVGLGYKDVQDLSVYVLFELKKQPDVYMLAWTTTPWTLHGNVALAINSELEYIKVKTILPKHTKEIEIIIAKTALSKLTTLVPQSSFEVMKEYVGSELIGIEYLPVFDSYSHEDAEFPIKDHETRRAHAWKVYSADFVTAEAGTGIVHIAPGYGEDDYKLSVKYNLPVIQHVSINGYTTCVLGSELGNRIVKSKGDTTSYDIDIIKSLAQSGSLFAKEKINHSYPHCWRCDTPLINLATSAWFIEVTKLQNKCIAENNTVNWIPESIGNSRFGVWLENLRDWNVSRARFWGAPLPVWKGETTGVITVIGSIAELASHIPKKNSYTIMRHGESTSNTQGVISSNILDEHGLTDKGHEEVKQTAHQLLKTLTESHKKITKIYSSDFRRTSETAKLMADAFDIPHNQIIYDSRLRECNAGISDGSTWANHWKLFANSHEKMFNRPSGGDSVFDVKQRVSEFMYQIDAELIDEEVLIVTHGLPLRLIIQTSHGQTARDLIRKGWSDESDATASLHALDWRSLPHNELFDLDIHRPYVDHVTWINKDTGEKMIRIPEVFDVWYDSGSMPFAQIHYPFENKDQFEKVNGGFFPADFISEGIDQTRGWFYSLLVLGVGLFDKVPYKNVVVNGLILAEDGRKMSKSLKNYPDMVPTIHKFGADALRYFLATSPATHGEEVYFSEKSLDEVNKKVFNRLDNIYSFLNMYSKMGDNDQLLEIAPLEIQAQLAGVTHPLDTWVLTKLNQLIETVTQNYDLYIIDKATRPIGEFIDEVSTWYLRRSRERFKGDNQNDKASAVFVTRFVLEQIALLMAPITPYTAEHIYGLVKMNKSMLSVHLASWPKTYIFGNGNHSNIIDEMNFVRILVEKGLAERAVTKIKVRQPLQLFSYSTIGLDTYLSSDLEDIIKDELNVKEVQKNQTLEKDSIFLDISITESLKKEGSVRELIRAVQQERKNLNLVPQDKINIISYACPHDIEIVKEYVSLIKETVSAQEIICISSTSDDLDTIDRSLKSDQITENFKIVKSAEKIIDDQVRKNVFSNTEIQVRKKIMILFAENKMYLEIFK